MTDDVDEIKKELEEIRRMKEHLKKELEEMKRQRRMMDSPPSRPHRPRGDCRHFPPPPRAAFIDLSGLTEGLEEIMAGVDEQIQRTLRSLDGLETHIHIPAFKPRRSGRRDWREIENIPPQRIAKILAPLGSEERLRILDYLRDGPRTFNEIENYSGRTGSSLTHHLNPLLEAGYVVKGEVRGLYYITVEGRLAYRLAQWLTSRFEQERLNNSHSVDSSTGNDSTHNVEVEFDDEAEYDGEPDEGHSRTEGDDEV